MPDYFPKSKKSPRIKRLLNEAIEILNSVGIPLTTQTERGLERIAMSFLAVSGVTTSWKSAKSLLDKRSLKTRDIIAFINQQFAEKISPGSYDDIRRKDLRLLVLANLVINSAASPDAATNDPTRGYSLEPGFAELIRSFKTEFWSSKLADFLQGKQPLSELLARQRESNKITVELPGNVQVVLSQGDHNLLQKKIIDDFLPRFAGDCRVLYIGDTEKKILHVDRAELARLNFFELSHQELPDIVAHDRSRHWLFLIEAVHSSGAMSEMRVLELK